MTARIVDHRAARRAALIAGVWAPLAIVAVAEAVLISMGATGPAQVVVHWGTNGPDRMGPWWELPLTVGIVGVSVIALLGVFIARTRRITRMSAWFAPISLGITVFHTVVLGGGTLLLSTGPVNPLVTILGGFVVAVAAVLITGFGLPRESPEPLAVAATPLPLAAGEVAAWSGVVEMSAAFVIAMVAIAAALVVLAVVLLVTAARAGAVLFIPAGLILLSLVCFTQWRVTAGASGFAVRSVVGWPALRVPVADIASAAAVTVDPMSEFGGWGPRWIMGPNGKGRWGFIARRGEGVEVVRRDGRSVVVTVDDAATAAAVLEAYAAGAR